MAEHEFSGCFLCKHGRAAYYQLEGRMAVSCLALKTDVPERNDCELFQKQSFQPLRVKNIRRLGK
jgi:hypothetical protein